ncbi:Translocon-associated protein, alpha subunit [Dictyocaulus viviparus]|uniref:Translocon-associated protein subunit alpha n=1 Tax=Dictyocaulus viviparus TaxID=29172 RepID=A0A0D8XYH3_DICVI|nr:Translocon-associated protein, alpha subunit [Dictyocaulus viviparus]
MVSQPILVFALCTLAFCSDLVSADDVIDGEVTDEQDIMKIEDDDLMITSSADAVVSFIFTQPASANIAKELYSGKVVKFLIGFQNRGEKDFLIKHSETSFRYPMDFSYNLQNFTHGQYNRRVAPKEEVTLDYAFFAHESFAARPLGLVVDLHYEDSEGHYVTNVFNETVTILEDDSGFNTETGFMYLIFIAFIIALFLIGQHFLNKLTRRAGMQKKRQPVVEQGTGNSEVDFEWIPREILKQSEKKSPKPSSPRNNGKAKKTN